MVFPESVLVELLKTASSHYTCPMQPRNDITTRKPSQSIHYIFYRLSTTQQCLLLLCSTAYFNAVKTVSIPLGGAPMNDKGLTVIKVLIFTNTFHKTLTLGDTWNIVVFPIHPQHIIHFWYWSSGWYGIELIQVFDFFSLKAFQHWHCLMIVAARLLIFQCQLW